jgi:hypothetical protein
MNEKKPEAALLLRELENEIADLRAAQVRIVAKLTRLEARRREVLEQETRVSPLGGAPGHARRLAAGTRPAARAR